MPVNNTDHGERLVAVELGIEHVRQEVKRNREENVSHAAATMAAIETLKTDLNERKGAEKLASALRTTFAGVIGAATVKIISWIGAVPIK